MDPLAEQKIEAMRRGAPDVAGGEAFAEASSQTSLITSAALASRGGPVPALMFAAAVAGGATGALLAANLGADVYVADKLEGAGMHRIGQPAPNGWQVARVGDQVAHSYAVAGFLAAIVVGIAVGALLVLTAGAGAVVLVGAAAAAGAVGGFLGSALGGALGRMGSPTGIILGGSPNVLVNGKPVARVTDLVLCSKEPAQVAIVEGNPTVFINGLPLARIGHKILCGAVVDAGSDNVLTGENSFVFATPAPDVPVWLRMAADWAFIVPMGAILSRIARSRPSTTSSQTKGGNPCSMRTCAVEPVDVATGEWIECRTDIDIPGVLPLQLVRVYASGRAMGSPEHIGLFGPRWADSFSTCIVAGQAGTLEYWDGEGVGWVFDTPNEEMHAAHLAQPDWRLVGTRRCPALLNRRTSVRSHFAWHGARARLERVEDSHGNYYTFHYSSAEPHQPHAITHSAGYQLRFERSGPELRTILHDSGAAPLELARHRFDDRQRLVHSQSEFSGQLYYRYDNQHRAIAWGDASHTHVQLHYDTAGRVCRVDTPQGIMGGSLSYDPARGETLVTQAGQTTLHRHNRDGLVTETVNPLGQRTRTGWDRHRRMASQTGFSGHTIHYHYSDLGELTGWSGADGQYATLERDSFGRCVRHTEEDGRTWRWHHSDTGLLLETAGPDGAARHRYSENGQLLATEAGDLTTHFEYDNAQRPCGRTAPNGAREHWQESRLGRITVHTDACGNSTRLEYAPAGEAPRRGLHRFPLAVVHANGDMTQTRYNQEGLPSESIDAAGQRQSWQWGPFDLLLAQTDAQGHSHQYQYDHAARLACVTNPLGQRWQREFDRGGQLVREQDFSGRTTHFEHDMAGLLRAKTTPDGCRTEYSHDSGGRLTGATTHDCEIQYSYGRNGLLAAARVLRGGEVESELAWEYDPTGRLVGAAQDGSRFSWRHDGQGRRVGRSGPHGAVEYGFDTLGLLAHLRAGPGELHIGRDAMGREIHRTNLGAAEWQAIEAGEQPTTPHFHLRQRHDAMGRLLEQQLAQQLGHQGQQHGPGVPGHPGNGSPLRSYLWRQGRLAGVDDTRFGRVDYSLDGRDQILQAQYQPGRVRGCGEPYAGEAPEPAGLESFSYTPCGDIASHGHVAPGQRFGRTVAQEYQRGILHARGAVRYRHDACGRLTSRTEARDGFRPKESRYKWDGFDRLVEAHTDDGAIWRYRYDAFGRRTGKRCVKPPQGMYRRLPNQDLREERTLWEGATVATQSKHYMDGSTEHLSWHYGPGSFTPLALVRQRGCGDPQFLHVVTDHLGTPRELVDGSGQVVWAAQLQVWGKLNQLWRKWEGDDADMDCVLDVDLRFPNQWQDTETGLFYNCQRYYDPESGQYLSGDPLGLEGGLRPQGYVHNPSTWVDPLGLAGCGAAQGGTPLSPETLRHSQNTISRNKIDRATGKPISFDDIISSMRKDGWKHEPVDVVRMPDGELTSIDNTRVSAAREAGIAVQANVRSFDEPLTQNEIRRFTDGKKIPATWGDAITIRIQKQTGGFGKTYPYGTYNPPRFSD